MTDSNNKSLQILCKHWAETRKRQETNDVKLKAETFTQELATLDEIKNLYVNDEDYVNFLAVSEEQDILYKKYCKIADNPNDDGLNNYLIDSLELLGNENIEEIDRSTWRVSTSLQTPSIKSLLDTANKYDKTPWLSCSQLGLNEDVGRVAKESSERALPGSSVYNTTHPLKNKRARVSPPSVPDASKLPKTSLLPDRLQGRIYPAKSTESRVDEVKTAFPATNPFESATSKYAKDCISHGKPIDTRIKRSLGGKATHAKSYQPPTVTKAPEPEELEDEWEGDERMKGIDKKLAKMIKDEIMDSSPNMSWNDIAGLESAKCAIKEIIVWPMLRPDIFKGIRGPPKGVLLFGPPGTGKTLIGKCIASQSRSTFFSISASSLTSKWIGEGEKLVRAMFALARIHQPSVVFIDEIDSLLTQRSESEHESSRRIKTEFLVQLDGVTSDQDDRLLVVGATNRPQELDEAARRRLVKRLYIPLPEHSARVEIVKRLLSEIDNTLSIDDMNKIANETEGYSGADMASLCRDAALAPLRDISNIENIDPNDVRPLVVGDILHSTKAVRSSVHKDELQHYEVWNKQFGSG